jgi:hypothetical protein
MSSDLVKELVERVEEMAKRYGHVLHTTGQPLPETPEDMYHLMSAVFDIAFLRLLKERERERDAVLAAGLVALKTCLQAPCEESAQDYLDDLFDRRMKGDVPTLPIPTFH